MLCSRKNHESHQRFGVPDDHEPLRLTVINHIDRGTLQSQQFLLVWGHRVIWWIRGTRRSVIKLHIVIFAASLTFLQDSPRLCGSLIFVHKEAWRSIVPSGDGSV
jgi:hypothetical protein